MASSMAMFERFSPPGLTGVWSVLFFLTCHTAFWMPFCKVVSTCVYKWLKNQPFAERHAKLNQKLRREFGMDCTLESASNSGCELIAACGCQHMIGSVLCVPAVFPFVAGALGINRDMAFFMASQGALCEAGFEIGDLIHRFYVRVIKGRADLQPGSYVAIMCLHHVLGISMVIPMTMYYGDLPQFHEMVLILQFAAGVGLALQQYGFMLDLSKGSELAQMKVWVVITLLCMLYFRGIRFCTIAYEFMVVFSEANSPSMMWAGGVALSAMALINFLMTVDACSKALKYIPMNAEVAVKLMVKLDKQPVLKKLKKLL